MKLASMMTGVAAAMAAEDPGWELFATAAPDVDRTCFQAPDVPSYVQGSYYVGGPAVFDLDKYTFQSLFDGYGKLNRFEIGGGQVCHTSKTMITAVYNTSRDSGRPCGMQFEDTTPNRPMCPLKDLTCDMNVVFDNNWVNMIEVGGELLWISDTPLKLSVDGETLDVIGTKPWADDTSPMGGMGGPMPDWVKSAHVATSGSAHPVKRPDSNLYIDILSEMGPIPLQSSFLDVYTYDAGVSGPQKRTKIGSLKLSAAPYLHSYGVTPNYVVLPINVKLGTPSFTNPLLLNVLSESFDGVYLMGLDGKTQKFNPTAFWHAHIVNSFENETGVTLDVGAGDHSQFSKNSALDTKMFLDKEQRDGEYDLQKNCVRRMHFHLTGDQAGETTEEDLICHGATDFFRIHPDFGGKPYCLYYATRWFHDLKHRANMAVVKHNVCTGEVTEWTKDAVYPGEPSLIPGPSGKEDDGVVTFVALNGKKGVSELVLLDAKTFEEIEVVELSTHIPFTAHGNFLKSPTVAMV